MGILKDKLAEQLVLRGFAEHTQIAYLRAVKNFIIYTKVPPMRLKMSHAQNYKLYLMKDLKRAPTTVNQYLAAIRFFYIYVLNKRWNDFDIPMVKHKRKLPTILSQDEMVQIFNATTNIKHKTMLMGLYSCGLRKSELSRLRYQDIDSERMLIHIRDSKGGKDRYVVLSEIFLWQLRKYWQETDDCKKYLLFPGGNPKTGGDPKKEFNPKSINEVLYTALRKAGIKKKVSVHALRHSYATHLLEEGVSMRYIQSLMGHSNITTTSVYTHVVDYRKANIGTPLESISDRLMK